RHHHLKTGGLKAAGDPVRGRIPLLTNDDVTLYRCRPAEQQVELYRNASADEVIFVHRGQGVLHTMFGPLTFRPFDYIVIPHTTPSRMYLDSSIPPDLLVIEAAGNVSIPARYLNPDGQVRLGAPYSERDFRGPRETQVIDRESDVTVLIKDRIRL